ncbi:3-dehydro-L-gulonate 2-dehydrogenase [Echinicola sp. CAU 1574]|uniref:3-dehydro-L-gulonate 2-dehydrogenase n=1 Tax=Echinicola arenosa TaxID=2774144 RepID=A0ABR9AQG3_9BACT|nr:3-dehydro-L-gulonate 2-dehydrogenase [Echinicola arenosa]MBD8490596.1 3-dehydro-L-gulonate 2-dehydrogenase [Echinicola arenosa]
MEDQRIPFLTLQEVLAKVLVQYQFSAENAELSAHLFAQSSLDGVPSHGLNRFLSYLNFIKKGLIDVHAHPETIASFGAFERWDGLLGPGNINAHLAMDRCLELAKSSGIGCVALQNTNHWMRAGNFGWQAVEAGCIGICFTNTKPNMPAWGGSEPKLGNNPLVVAIPRQKGPVVLDMAMSQFAYGKMAIYEKEGKELPYEAGFDQSGKLTKSPKEIIEHELALPIGLWKGAGLSLMIDMLAVLLSGGEATHEVGKSGEEYGLSQVFVALDPNKFGMKEWMEEKSDGIIGDLSRSATFDGKGKVRYPGENTLKIREENMEKGVPVDIDIWNGILSLIE